MGIGASCFIYTATDSLVMHLTTDDVYEDVRCMKEHVDSSSYPANHPDFDKSNAKVLGKFKDVLMVSSSLSSVPLCLRSMQ